MTQPPRSRERPATPPTRVPGARIARVPVRTLHAVRKAAGRGSADAPLPRVRPTAGFTGAVLLDELVLGLVAGPRRIPDAAELDRVTSELQDTHALFRREGWLDAPSVYHPTPPTADPKVRSRTVRGVVHDHLTWSSGHVPHEHHPGAARWLAAENNRTAHASVLRADDPRAPWVVCVHGLGTGLPTADFHAFRAPDLRDWLGVNVVLPVLPRHGNRRIRRTRFDEFLSHDLVHALHGIAQAVWDIRSLLAWVQDQPGGDRVAMHGISLGGYLTALVTALHDGIDAAVVGIPVVDIPRLFLRHAPAELRPDALERGLIGDMAAEVFSVVSPLTFASRVPHAGRAVYAGLGDRMTTPEQAVELWRHWEEPAACWFPGNHVGAMFHRDVRSFVGGRLRSWRASTRPDDLAPAGPAA